ncbi:MAG: DUF456 domain-containing protein [Bacteroidales bacterium]|nr:DUF456 domain-containing protein [Bacteroidales bacterium]
MDWMQILAVIAGVIGVIGSVLPGLPGPPISWIGMLLAFLAHGTNGAGDPMSKTMLFVWLGIVTLVTVLDYVVPAMLTKATGGHKAASTGAIIGLFAGMFIPPIGMILGSLLGAFLGEYAFAKQTAGDSFRAALGAFLGFICGTGMKLICSGVMLYYIIVYI